MGQWLAGKNTLPDEHLFSCLLGKRTHQIIFQGNLHGLLEVILEIADIAVETGGVVRDLQIGLRTTLSSA